MSIEVSDNTGKPPTNTEIAEALSVVRKYRIDMKFLMSTPELGVQLGNISRILEFAEVIVREMAKRQADRR